MALTAAEYLELRDLTGGRTTTNDKDHLTDDELQAIYDNRAGADWDLTIVHTLRRRIAMASRYVDKAMNVNSVSMSQYVKHLRDMLKDAEARTGQAGGTLTAGVLDYNIDTDYDDLDIA